MSEQNQPELTGAEKKATELEQYKVDCFEAESEVAKAAEEVRDIEDQIGTLKGKLKAAQGGMSDAIKHLRDVVRCRAEKQHALKFQHYTGEDGWREYPVSKLDIPESLIAALQDHQLRTLGDIADYTKDEGRLTDISGVGEKNAEAIEEALTRFWAEYNSAKTEDEDE